VTAPFLVVPEALAASHRRYFGEAGRRWVDALPALAWRCLERWQLRLDGPPAHGAVALVLPVLRADGTPAALKLQPVDDETRGEAAALRCWAGRGAVGLYEHDPESGSMLLERLDASRALTVIEDDLAAVAVIARLLAALHTVQAAPGLRRLGDVGQATADAVPRALRQTVDPDEHALLRRCADHLSELLAQPVRNDLLHWDLHYANVLARADDAGSWRAIDPKPLGGEPGFELLPALWNRWADVVASGDPAAAVLRRFDLMTETLGLDRSAAAAWTLARVLQNACWDLGSSRAVRIEPAQRSIAEVLLQRRVTSRPPRGHPGVAGTGENWPERTGS
jgi:streptomycin 6-kinase